ncbi:disease resistance protein RPV1 isoform X1 [Lactuca sativa]|uniref:TIR domain-containing protein n=2 Tax=Lactuca sativa TaxID=4236 RepID=A0A9R1UE28_LACSA|nr:disease resistance protein RPV1 isoform X1 [Lactuca sativa]KAJ0185416.1 hypothetical protein LSAT_V11C900462400 [Lactuca sativa]
MASCSTSSVDKSYKYDVFLSFRGEDTRANFVDHLYTALQQKNIHTYKDNERIKKGKKISDELIGSIEESKFYIVVFSKNYASSSWCLDELVKIMDCHNTTEHTAYPVFYDVEPTEVRKQSGAVGEAFSKHTNHEKSDKWREALQEAADLAGWELKNTTDGHEAKFIQKIVEEISLELRSISFGFDEKLVGMETRVKDAVSFLEMGSDDVRMIGIKGMGGGGKTTLARAVFDQISFRFEGKCFVENVREVSNASLFGLKSLQNQLLSDVLNDKGISVSGVYEGKSMIKKMMRGRKVLLVLDDVDHTDQLEALAGEPNWFKAGSRIIITTRDEQVLVAHRVKLILAVNLLSFEEAVCLFSRYAFGKEMPIRGYEEKSVQVISYAAGLPLTIKVLGSFLCGKSELEWIDAIDRLKTIPLMETLKKLELSYIGLEEDYKEIFLDIACILKGERKHFVIEALESCGFHARNGLRVLEQKSLITIHHNSSYNNKYVFMHDHLVEMGRNIVRRLHPYKPNEHSRLWIDMEIEDILANDLGTEATRYIQFSTRELNPEVIMKGLRKMKELRYLDMSLKDSFWNWKCDELSPYFPNALRILLWSYYPFRSLPETFQANNLVSLEMEYSRIVQLCEGRERKVLNKLRFLDLSYSKLRTLDLGIAPNLETLSLSGCVDLVEFHIPSICLKLRSLDLCDVKLRILNLQSAPNLELLDLRNSLDLVQLHMPGRCVKLRSIIITNSKLRTLDIGLTPNLEKLDLDNSYDLGELHMADVFQKLVKLYISRSKLRTLDLRLAPNLKNLDLSESNDLVELHAPTGCLKEIVCLELSACLRFRSFYVEPLEEVDSLAELHLVAESLERCPFHPDNSLPKFRFTCFYKDGGLPSRNTNIEKLISQGLCACTNLETFSESICELWGLRKLKLKGYPEVPKDLDQLEYLEVLILSSTKIKHLPDSICYLTYLQSLKLESCWLLEELPEDLGQLENLKKLTLSSTMIKHLPDSICMLKHLESLQLISCWLLENLPEDIGRLECLENLTLSSAKIKHLPDSICMLKHLKSLQLKFCWLLEKLPEDIGRLESLEKLTLSCTKIKDLPDSISMIKHLECLQLNHSEVVTC